MNNTTVIQAIQQITKTRLSDKVYIAACTVNSVNALGRTCDCTAIDGKAEVNFPGVQLMAEVDDGELKIPAIGSTVIIAYSEYVLPFVLMYSSIDSIIFMGGDLGGMVKVIDLTTKLNNLENLVNDLVGKYNTHVHGGVTTGGGVSGITNLIESTTLTPTNQTEIENTKITQG